MTMDAVLSDERLLARVEAQKLGALHVFVLCLCAIAFGFDLAELGLGNILSAIFSAAPYKAPPAQLSWLLAAPYVGGIVGAPAYGWLADRWGRRSTLIVMMVSLGVFSILASRSDGLEILAIWRLLCGLTLGAFPPIVIAYMTDLLPAKGRGRALMVTCAVAILAVPLSIFFMRWLTPLKPFGLDAWRCGFILYGLGSILTGAAMLGAPETVRWLVKMGRPDQALAVLKRLGGALGDGLEAVVGRAEEAARPVNLKAWQIAVLAAFSFLAAWASVAFPLLSGAILVQKGVKVPDALLYVGIASFGPFVSMSLSAFVIDRLGRRPGLWLAGGMMIVTAAAFVLGTAPWMLIASGLLFQIANSIFVPTSSLYMAEVFSTRRRGRATSILWAVNRSGSVVAPLVMVPLLRGNGPFPLFLITATTLLLCMALLIIMPRGRAGQTVD